LNPRFSLPFRAGGKDKWNVAKKRVLLVGQETDLWRKESEGSAWQPFGGFRLEKIPNDVMSYQKELTKVSEDSKRTPFWRFYWELRKGGCTVLWTNSCRADAISIADASGPRTNPLKVNTTSISKTLLKIQKENLADAQKGILKGEIEILRPDLVLLCTGPNYLEFVKNEVSVRSVPRPTMQDPWAICESLDQMTLSPIVISSYHPGFLNRKGWLNDFVEFSLKAIK